MAGGAVPAKQSDARRYLQPREECGTCSTPPFNFFDLRPQTFQTLYISSCNLLATLAFLISVLASWRDGSQDVQEEER